MRSGIERAVRVAREHLPFFLVLGGGALIRIGAAIAYRPALFFSDSFGYLYGAYDPAHAHILIDKPSGYAFFLSAAGIFGPDLAAITVIQHVLGLLTGALLYVTLLKLNVSRVIAAVASAVVLLDAYLIALEQVVLTESLFTMTLACAVFLAILKPWGTWGLVLSGVSLAATITIRYAALFAVPVWLVYIVRTTRPIRRVAVTFAALGAPLIVYFAWHLALTGQLLAEMDGWLAYARVGQIADCSKIDVPEKWRDLCGVTLDEPDAFDHVDFYLWHQGSPAYQRFGDPYGLDRGARAAADHELRRFSLHVIRERPVAYARIVGRDFVRFFEPYLHDVYHAYDAAIGFPRDERPQLDRMDELTQWFGDHDRSIHAPASALVAYHRWVHLPRVLMGAFTLAALIELALCAHPARGRLTHRWNVFLTTGMGVALLVGSVMSHFEIRYMVPTASLLTTGGILACKDLTAFFRRRSPD